MALPRKTPSLESTARRVERKDRIVHKSIVTVHLLLELLVSGDGLSGELYESKKSGSAS